MSPVFENYYNLALRFLSFRPRSEKEVRDYLKRKKLNDLDTEKIIKKLKEYKFLDDKEFTHWWAKARSKQKALRVIKFELKQKGIDPDLITDLEDNDLKTAKNLAEKKRDSYKNLTKDESNKKLMGYLLRRGFSYDIVKKVLDY